jgi:hypothetical protein
MLFENRIQYHVEWENFTFIDVVANLPT